MTAFAFLDKLACPAIARRAKAGAEEIRTPDPHVANVVLYQLSYRPICRSDQ